jgi:hypothetical protein
MISVFGLELLHFEATSFDYFVIRRPRNRTARPSGSASPASAIAGVGNLPSRRRNALRNRAATLFFLTRMARAARFPAFAVSFHSTEEQERAAISKLEIFRLDGIVQAIDKSHGVPASVPTVNCRR